MKSTPITFMEQTTAIQTLQQRQTTNKCPSSSREIQVPPRSSHEGEGRGRTKNRIKRSSFTHEIKKLHKDIAENFSPETWTRVYTDGSATKAPTDGSAGIIIQYPNGATQTVRSATGKHCTNYRAEIEVLNQAATLVKDPNSLPH